MDILEFPKVVGVANDTVEGFAHRGRLQDILQRHVIRTLGCKGARSECVDIDEVDRVIWYYEHLKPGKPVICWVTFAVAEEVKAAGIDLMHFVESTDHSCHAVDRIDFNNDGRFSSYCVRA